MRRWTAIVCLLSTGIYAVILPSLIIINSLAAEASLLALYLVPPTIVICSSAAWYSLAMGRLGRARLLCFIPALTFLLIYLIAH